MDNRYHVFGLNIASVIPLPAPPVLHRQGDHGPDVLIEYGDIPDALTNPRFKGLRFQAGEGEFLLRVDGVARYYVQKGHRIVVAPEDGTDEDDILVFLMGSIMGALLHQRNILVLHAGAIEANGGGVIFSGPSGSGKSTLTAGFHRRGYPFLADDVCAITTMNGHPAVIPGFPRLKLWADCLNKLNADKNELKSIRWSRNMEKYYMSVDSIPHAPVPLKSVFVLKTANTEKIEISVLRGAEKINPIINNTYRLRFLDGLGGKKDHFRQCAAVAARAAVYRTVQPHKGFLLDELMDLVESML